MRVDRIAALLQECIERFRTFQIVEGDGNRAERIVRQFALRTLERIAIAQLAVVDEHTVDHFQERGNAFFGAALLEERPAVLVQTLIVVAAGGTGRNDCRIRRFGVAITRRAEKQLASPELRLRGPFALRELRDHLVQHCKCFLGLRLRFVRTRELVHDRVVALVFRILLEQRFIQLDRFLVLQAIEVRGTSGARGFIDFDLQIAQPAHRLRSHLFVRRFELEEALVLLDGLLRLNIRRRIALDLDLAILEILDRAGGLGLLVGERGRAGDQCRQQCGARSGAQPCGRVTTAHCPPSLPGEPSLPEEARS